MTYFIMHSELQKKNFANLAKLRAHLQYKYSVFFASYYEKSKQMNVSLEEMSCSYRKQFKQRYYNDRHDHW